jgi:hypothetical protein
MFRPSHSANAAKAASAVMARSGSKAVAHPLKLHVVPGHQVEDVEGLLEVGQALDLAREQELRPAGLGDHGPGDADERTRPDAQRTRPPARSAICHALARGELTIRQNLFLQRPHLR